MTPILSFIEEQLAVCEKASPGPWDDKPASHEWLKNAPNNYIFCRKARTNYPAVLKALEVAVGVMESRVESGHDGLCNSVHFETKNCTCDVVVVAFALTDIAKILEVGE